jgi:PAS domain S-box-containing protein
LTSDRALDDVRFGSAAAEGVSIPGGRVGRAALVAAVSLALMAFTVGVATDALTVGALAYTPAVAAFALATSVGWGAAGGALAACLFAVASELSGHPRSDVALLTRAGPLIVTGALIGWLGRRLRDTSASARSAQQRAEECAAHLRALFDSALDAIVVCDDERRCVEANEAVLVVLGVEREALIGRRIDDFIIPEAQPQLAARWAAFVARGRGEGDFEFVTVDGLRREVEFKAVSSFQSGRHLSVLRDVTQRRRDECALKQRAAVEQAIADLGLLALRGAELLPLTAELTACVDRTLGVERVAVLELVDDSRRLRPAHAVGWPALGDVAVEAGTQMAAVLESQELLAADGSQEERFTGALRPGDGVDCCFIALVRGREKAWGAIAVADNRRRGFSADDINFVRACANTLALAVEQSASDAALLQRTHDVARLARERQMIVAEALAADEHARERISQQLHDEPLQKLFAVRQDLAAAARSSGDQTLANARDAIRDVISDLRAVVYALHPVLLDQRGVGAAIAAAAHDQARRGGFEVDVSVPADIEPGPDRARLILSLAQELLANVTRHANADHAAIRLRRVGDDLLLEFWDDGRGMQPGRLEQALETGHIGLASAIQRVEAVGGRLEIDSFPGWGTTVLATIPRERSTSDTHALPQDEPGEPRDLTKRTHENARAVRLDAMRTIALSPADRTERDPPIG